MKKKTVHFSVFLLVVLFVVLLCTGSVSAQGVVDLERKANLTIQFVDKELNLPIPGAKFDLFKVGDIRENGSVQITEYFRQFIKTEPEAIDVEEWGNLAATLMANVKYDDREPDVSGVTDEKGKLLLEQELGLYLIVGYKTEANQYYYTSQPALVLLPERQSPENEWRYDVEVYPKYVKEPVPITPDPPPPPIPPDPPTPPETVKRKVIKVWDDLGYETIRPKSVKVILLCDGEEYASEILSDENNWRNTWENLPAGHEWLVVEREVNEHELDPYTVVYTQEGVTFIMTNRVIPFETQDDPPIWKRLIGDVPDTDLTFDFVLRADDLSYPMPAGSVDGMKKVSITGAGRTAFGTIKFTEPGIYTYTVYEIDGGVPLYTYDHTVFQLIYEVTLTPTGLYTKKTIIDNEDNLRSALEFTNSYHEPPEDLPQTGALWWPVPILVTGGVLLIGAGIIRRRRSKE